MKRICNRSCNLFGCGSSLDPTSLVDQISSPGVDHDPVQCVWKKTNRSGSCSENRHRIGTSSHRMWHPMTDEVDLAVGNHNWETVTLSDVGVNLLEVSENVDDVFALSKSNVHVDWGAPVY